MALTLEEMKANRRKWVEALRSGEYEQTSEALRRTDGSMCCLGVLSELAGCEFRPDPNSLGTLKTSRQYHVADAKAMSFVGLATCFGGPGTDLALMNDQGKTFSEIADIIESEPAGLFIEPAESA